MNGIETTQQLENITGKQWKLVPGWAAYAVSEDGEVYALSRLVGGRRIRGKYLKPFYAAGYATISMCYEGVASKHRVHRLVLQAFVGPQPPGKPLGLHKDDNRANNHYTNLYWGDALDNAADRTRNGHTLMGEQSGRVKLTTEKVLEIRSRAGENQYDLAAEFGVCQATISLILSGRKWKHI